MSNKYCEESTGPFGTKVNLDMDEAGYQDPVTPMAFRIYHLVTDRIDHVLELCEGPNFRDQKFDRMTMDVSVDSIHIRYQRQMAYGSSSYGNDEFPIKYLFIPDEEIIVLETELRRVRLEAEEDFKKRRQAQDLATKRQQYEALKKELGEG